MEERISEPTWIVSHDVLMELLERAFGGEHPMAIYAELTIMAEEVMLGFEEEGYHDETLN